MFGCRAVANRPTVEFGPAQFAVVPATPGFATEDLAAVGKGRDARADVHGYPPDVFPAELAFACVHAGANF